MAEKQLYGGDVSIFCRILKRSVPIFLSVSICVDLSNVDIGVCSAIEEHSDVDVDIGEAAKSVRGSG
jgi:hypothetical protein